MNPLFSILIPTWNNLPYLRLCIESLRKHSDFQHQIIVMVNEGQDGTHEWVSSQSDLEYIASPENIGICYGLNACRPLIKNPYVVYANDDMYFLPHWDSRLCVAIEQSSSEEFMLSATMIEPNGDNPCCVIADFGDGLESFKEEALLQAADNLARNDWSGSTWPPVLVPLALWDKVGGMSVEFSPGMYSDPDLSRKLWECGVRHFQGVGNSLVYHFGCKSTGRIRQNKGRRTFLMKWGISANQFMHDYLHIGEQYIAPLPDFMPSRWKQFSGKIKQLTTIIKGK
jgi:GT2 family glycosyltransferase